jgi:gas vesicle protein
MSETFQETYRTGEESYRAGDWLLGTVKRNPEGLLLLAAGAALLMRSSQRIQSRGRSAASRKTSQIAEAAKDTSKKYASGIAEGARKNVESVTSAVSGYAADATKMASETSDRAFQQVQSTVRDTVNQILQEQPLVVAIAGMAAGAALAWAFPTTTLEKEALGPIGEKFSKAADRVGNQIKEATTKAGETIKHAAEERDLTRDGLKDVVNEVTDVVKDTMGSAPSHAGASHSGHPSGSRKQGGPTR